MEVSVTHLISLGYIPSWLPKSPKPDANMIEDDASYSEFMDVVENHVAEGEKKRGGLKAFTIKLLDTSGGDVAKPKGGKGKGKVRCAMTLCDEPLLTRAYDRQRIRQQK